MNNNNNIAKALLVIDMQNDFIDGSLGTPEAIAILPAVKAKIEQYATDPDAVIFFTRDTHGKDYLATQEGKNLPVEHCLVGTSGWEIADGLIPKNLEDRCMLLNKPSFGYTGWKQLLDEIGELKEIELCGLCTDICVVSNALIVKALYPEVPLKIDATCCAGVTPEKHEAALETMRSCQINVIE